MSRRPEHLGKRRDFSAKIKAEARERADGHCEKCGTPFADDDPQEVDHITPDGLGGTNTLDNAQVLGSRACLCHPKKTAEDLTRMTKADRQGQRTGRQRPNKRRRNWPSKPMPGSKASGFKQKFSGEVEKR